MKLTAGQRCYEEEARRRGQEKRLGEEVRRRGWEATLDSRRPDQKFNPQDSWA